MSGKKILVVEDDPDMRRALHIRLQAHGYETAWACDAVSAISQACSEKPDLVLLDLGLPGGDGFMVMVRLRALSPLALLPIIVVSAREEAPNRDRARRAGATGYFRKPVDADILASGIRRVLAGERLWGPDP